MTACSMHGERCVCGYADDGGPAFPQPIGAPLSSNSKGMTLRQYYAGQALITMMKDTYIGSEGDREKVNRGAIRHAVAMADMLIEELNG